jgi:GTP-binding protein
MQFIDEAEIHVKAGDGGAGAVAFRREKYAPRGGPSGGDGGNGADVVLVTDERLTTLLDFRFKREYRARNGEPGRGRDQNGHAAAELVLKVPPGTVIKDVESGEVLADLRENDRRWVLAKGGRGGLGNMNFATSTLQAPRFAQPGTEGEEKRVKLELRLLADVGLVGFPNAGKSTLVSRLSRARPKIADYPFTTLQPHLGVVQYKDGRSFVLSDLPGLIEGAHAGAGLGHRFLKHMQRCRVIVHLIDASALERDLVEGFDAINRELELFDPALRRKPQVVAANKIDLPEARERAADFQRKLKRRKIEVRLVSAATGEGLDELLDAMVRALDAAGMPQPLERDLRSEGRDGEPMSDDRVSVGDGGTGVRAGVRGGQEGEDEREEDRVEKEQRAPARGRRARERKARAKRR